MFVEILEPLGPLCQNGGGPGGYGPGYGMGYGPYGWSHMMSPLGGGLFMIVLLVLVFFLMFRFSGRCGTPGPGPTESALDILKKRYARGEIGREDFERMKDDLKD